jgi:hypothetical protein
VDTKRACLRYELTVSVGLNSTQIAGPNAKRFRLTIYPVSLTPVWVSSTGPATVNGGPVVVQGQKPVEYGDGEHEGAFNQSIQAVANAAGAVVSVVDEFYG